MDLSVISIGHVHAEHLTALRTHFSHLEQLVIDINRDSNIASYRNEFNRAVDAGAADWMLIIRERETVDEALAKEIADAAVAAKARGFRIRSVPFYAGAPLRIGSSNGGEIRLFHKRHYLRFANKGEWEELQIQGTIVRLDHELRSVTFASSAEHLEYVAKHGRKRSALARTLLFVRFLFATRTLDTTTLRYLWIEAGYDQENVAPSGH